VIQVDVASLSQVTVPQYQLHRGDLGVRTGTGSTYRFSRIPPAWRPPRHRSSTGRAACFHRRSIWSHGWINFSRHWYTRHTTSPSRENHTGREDGLSKLQPKGIPVSR